MKERTGRLTRRELYDLVWQTPVDKIAREFGMSGRGLGKLCERYGIPVPPRGYWARKAAGQRARRPPLIELEGQPTSEIEIRVSAVSKSPASSTPEGEPKPDPFKELFEQQMRESRPARVAERLANPHPVIAGWLEEDRRGQERARRYGWGASMAASKYVSPLARRMLRIQSALFKELEASGFRVEASHRHPSSLVVRHRHEEVQFDLKERIRQYRRELTAEEKADHWNPRAKWTQLKEPTGELVLKLTSPMPRSVPTEWCDDGAENLEQKLHIVVAGFIVAIAYARDLSERRAAEQRRRWEAEQEALRREQERKAELARKEALREQARRWREAADLRAYVAAVRAAAFTGTPIMPADRLDGWVNWALAQADEIDPLIVKST